MKAVVLAFGIAGLAAPSWSEDLAGRVRADARRKAPLVVHVVVALCDNVNQGIVPVPRALGNGQDPAGNLYWGARYGVRAYFGRASGWSAVRHTTAAQAGVLERVVFRSNLAAGQVLLVADAWDGARIREALAVFLGMASGRDEQAIEVDGRSVRAGGQAHVVVFLGHNGLMDFAAPAVAAGTTRPARAAMVLACASKPYFGELLSRCGAYPLLLTTGLMAPEAYSLEAAVRTWFSTTDPGAVRLAAAAAYDSYQKCGSRAARRLFSADHER